MSIFNKRWFRWSSEVLIFLSIFFVVSWWQQKDLLASDRSVTVAPIDLPLLQGSVSQLDWSAAKPTIIYFFAPWCKICHLSIDNLEEIKRADTHDNIRILIVALSYEDVSEVANFLEKHDITVPVVLGNRRTHLEFKIAAFPTYYLLNSEREIVSKSVGYSTELGLRARLLLNDV